MTRDSLDHLLFPLPKKRKLTKNKSVDQYQYLVERKYHDDIEQNTGYTLNTIKAYKVKKKWLNEQDCTARKGKNNQDHNSLKQGFQTPLGL